MFSKGLSVALVLASVAFTKAAPCLDECGKKFHDDAKVLEACNKGCANFNAALSLSKFDDQDNSKPVSVCQHSCEDAFPGVELIKSREACQEGCQASNRPVSRPRSLMDLLFGHDDFFRGLEPDDQHRGGGLSISFGLPQEARSMMLPGLPSWANQQIGGMMQQMNSMMESMKPMMSSGNISGGGKMVMIQSGPGYHEEKTYDIGPDGKVTLIKNDMMEQHNPLELGQNKDEVEVFEPFERSNKETKVWNAINDEFSKIVRSQEREALRERELIDPIVREIDRNIAQHASVYGTDHYDGPRLPETGLRSRDICYMDSKALNWSDWMSCLHLRLGMPRWVMTSTICLGIIFLIWLCLVIPASAPRQKVQKQVIGKEAEALATAVNTKEKYPIQDLPPAYEDVANLTVQLEPVHQPTKKAMA